MMSIHRKSQAGSVVIESALWLTLLLILGIGAVNCGLAVQASLVVADAANAGALYGANSNYNATDTAGMQQAALNTGASVSGLSATASYWCTCSGGALLSCSTDCGSSADLKHFVQVTTTATYPSLIKLPWLPAAFTLQSVSVMPVE